MATVAVIAVLLAAVAIGWTWNNSRADRSADEVAVTLPEDAGKTVDDPGAEWQAKVELEHLSETNPRYETSRLSLTIRSARGKEIETADTSFEVNGAPLAYFVGRGISFEAGTVR